MGGPSSSASLVEDDPLPSTVPIAFLDDLGLLSISPFGEESPSDLETVAFPPLPINVHHHQALELDAVFDSWPCKPKVRRESSSTHHSLASLESTEVSLHSEDGLISPPLLSKTVDQPRTTLPPPHEAPSWTHSWTSSTALFPPFGSGIWSPPQWSSSSGEGEGLVHRTEMLVLREENELLRAERDIALQKIQQLTAMLANCVVTPAQIAPTRSQFNSLDLLLPPYHQNEDPRQSATLPPHLYQTSNPFPSTAILDPLTAVDLILKGKVDYVRMNKRSDFEVVNSLVSTISQEQFNLNMPPKGLKEATITLGKFLGQPKSPLYTQYMVKIITEAAKSLCLTSNGNYLCQQLLEKCNSEDKLSFIKQIEKDMFAIANDMFGVHVLVKAVGIKELEVASVQVCADSQAHIVAAMVSYGIYESLQTGARKVWRPYLSKCRAAGETEIFEKIKGDMTGHWADLAVSSQHGTISVQQMFEGCATQDVVEACFNEILEDLCRVATNEFGHYLIKRFLGLEPMFHAAIFTGPMFNALCNAILTSYPPLATNYYGVRFVETVIDSNRILQRPNAIKYLNSLCSQKDGRIPAIVEVANSSVGRGHLQFVLRHMPRHGDGGLMGRVRSTCRQFQTTLRNSQSGNELLRRLGLINTPSRRF